jgi:HEAT repeat protein
LVDVVDKHPTLAKQVIGVLARGEQMKSKALPHLRRLARHEHPTIRAVAIAGVVIATINHTSDLAELAAGADDVAHEDLHAAFGDGEAQVRIAACKSLFVYFELLRNAHLQAMFEDVTEVADEEAEAGSQGPVWDQWLAGFYDGKQRPAWAAKFTDPLDKMLESGQAEERAAAALALVPLGHADRAVPELIAVAKDNRGLIAETAQALPWLVWSEREGLLRQLLALEPSQEVLDELLAEVVPVQDFRAAPVLWELLGKEHLPMASIATINQVLESAYFGSDSYYYDSDELSPVGGKMAAADAEQRLRNGTIWQKVLALVLLSRSAPTEATGLAANLMDAPEQVDDVRKVAFQVCLATQPRTQRREAALAGIRGQNPDRKKLALGYLVFGTDWLVALRVEGVPGRINLGVIDEEDFTGNDQAAVPIIPDPPQGITPNDVRDLTDDPDPTVAAHAAYILALFGESSGLETLLRLRASAEIEDIDLLTYRAIATLNDSSRLPILREIYAQFSYYETSNFYWTIRIMSGPEILQFRKEIRDKVGMNNLR